MYEVQGLPSQRKSIHWVWSALAGLAVGASVASGVFWFLMREQQKRHQAELVAVTTGAVNPAALVAGAMGLANGASLAPAESTPTKDEIAAYFDGKTLPLPDGDNVALNNGEKSSKSCVIKKDGVEAVQKSGGWSSGGEAWNTNVVLLYDAGDARYAVDAEIQHKPVGGKSAFFGFTVKKVARQ